MVINLYPGFVLLLKIGIVLFQNESSWSIKLLKLGLSGKGMEKELGSTRYKGLILLV